VTIPFGQAHLPAGRLGPASPPIPAATRASSFVEEALAWLPGKGDGAGLAADALGATSPAIPAQAPGLGGRVLLADDNADMRSYIGRLLTAEGFAVEAVADGEAALAAARRTAPDLVMSDVMMPGLDGFGLLRALRAEPRLRDVPVVLLSARAGEEARVEGLEAGADDYLTKPFRARELVARVSAALSLARSRREAALQDSEARLRQRREERLDLLARASASLLEAPDPDTVLGPVLAEGAAVIGFDQAYIYSVAPDGAHLCLTHSVGVGEETQAALAYVPFSGPLCGIVAETARPLIIEHVLATTEPRYAPAREAGLNAYVSYPVFADGRVVSVMCFGCFGRPAFTADELDLLATLARFVSVVRERLDREASLERRIEARTAELREREEQLRQAQKMEAVGQLTGGLAHDFNNLLAGISGSLELLQARVAQGRIGDLERYLTAAQGAAKRAAALTHRLLAFSRRQTLDPKPTDANRLVVGMEELVRRTVGPEVAVEVVAAGGLWATLVDPNQLENALLNLCINARDAMPGGGQLTIETGNKWLDERGARERDLDPGQYVSLCVSDNGTGMTPEVIARAFDPFFTTKPIGMGTGLGLSMVYGFTRQSGGQARIYSEPGQGTMVCLYLPRHHGEAETADVSGELAEAPRAEQGETVLVVDDEPTVRMLVADVLGDLGYTAIEAADGTAGLKVLQSNARIDLLVTDVGLPGMNGRQVADAGRVARPGLKVLFITGYAENAVLNHGHLDPGMHVLTKPFAMDALANRIKELIAGP